MRFYIICYSLVYFLFACKKEKSDPIVPEPVAEEPDFVLIAADLNYPIGTTWAYSLNTQTMTFNQPTQTYDYQYGGGNYTVKVIRDSNMTGNITGKIFQYTIGGLNFKELQYVDASTNFFNQIVLTSVNGNTISPNGFSIKLPLTVTGKWKNVYYPMESVLDSFNAAGFENLTLNPGYLKCIKFKANNCDNIYWYNKFKGFTKGISTKYTAPNPTLVIAETTTITLTGFN